jgi:NADH-quinone oxidoreductase subunit J
LIYNRDEFERFAPRFIPLTGRLIFERLQSDCGGAMHLILFFIFAGFCLAGAINLLLQSHPINSALSLIVVMTSLAVLYLLLGAEFLAAAQVIVYAGAIMVLFTFVVMLLNAGREERTLGSRASKAVGFPGVVVILAVLATVMLRARGLGAVGMQDGITGTEELGKVLFTELLLPFEVTSVLILIAILGVVATVILRAQGLGSAGLQDGITSTEELSGVLFTELLLPFEVTSVLILIAILGAVALAQRDGERKPGR